MLNIPAQADDSKNTQQSKPKHVWRFKTEFLDPFEVISKTVQGRIG